MPDSCGGCGASISEEVERTTRRLLASLDDERRARLAETYHGEAPEVLCATCFLPTVATLNGAMA
jgi:hypothetical protein